MSRELSPWAEPPDDGDHDGLEEHWDRRIEQDGDEASPEPD